jgi:hypothetical protein
MTTNIYTPFTYLIGWKELDRWYYRSSFCEKLSP